MQVKRGEGRKSAPRACGCPLALLVVMFVVVVTGALLAPALPSVLMRIVGFYPAAPRNIAPPADISEAFIGSVSQAQVTLQIDGAGQLQLPQVSKLSAELGRDEEGNTIARLEFSEQELLALCQQFGDSCSERGNPIRNARFRLDSAGIAVSGEAYVDVLGAWQNVELYLVLESENTVRVDNISLGGVHYKVPDNELGRQIRSAEASVNQILQQSSVRASGKSFRLSRLAISQNRLVAILR